VEKSLILWQINVFINLVGDQGKMTFSFISVQILLVY